MNYNHKYQNIVFNTPMSAKYCLELCLNDMLGACYNLMRRFELCELYDKWDLLNTAYIKMHDGMFNSIDHFKGSMYKYLKLALMTECRNNKRISSFNELFYSNNEKEEKDSEDKIEDLIQCIELEPNVKHKNLMRLVSEGYEASYISEQIGIDLKNMRFHLFAAKTKLIKRLNDRGYKIKKGDGQMDRLISCASESVNIYPIYNDYPIENPSYINAILFVLKKENKPIERNYLLNTIAKNKGLKLTSCRYTYLKALDKMKTNKIITIIDNYINLI